MSPPGRHVLALTNSQKAAEILEAQAREDFTSVECHVARYPGYGWCVEISVDAIEYDRWCLT